MQRTAVRPNLPQPPRRPRSSIVLAALLLAVTIGAPAGAAPPAEEEKEPTLASKAKEKGKDFVTGQLEKAAAKLAPILLKEIGFDAGMVDFIFGSGPESFDYARIGSIVREELTEHDKQLTLATDQAQLELIRSELSAIASQWQTADTATKQKLVASLEDHFDTLGKMTTELIASYPEDALSLWVALETVRMGILTMALHEPDVPTKLDVAMLEKEIERIHPYLWPYGYDNDYRFSDRVECQSGKVVYTRAAPGQEALSGEVNSHHCPGVREEVLFKRSPDELRVECKAWTETDPVTHRPVCKEASVYLGPTVRMGHFDGLFADQSARKWMEEIRRNIHAYHRDKQADFDFRRTVRSSWIALLHSAQGHESRLAQAHARERRMPSSNLGSPVTQFEIINRSGVPIEVQRHSENGEIESTGRNPVPPGGSWKLDEEFWTRSGSWFGIYKAGSGEECAPDQADCRTQLICNVQPKHTWRYTLSSADPAEACDPVPVFRRHEAVYRITDHLTKDDGNIYSVKLPLVACQLECAARDDCKMFRHDAEDNCILGGNEPRKIQDSAARVQAGDRTFRGDTVRSYSPVPGLTTWILVD